MRLAPGIFEAAEPNVADPVAFDIASELAGIGVAVPLIATAALIDPDFALDPVAIAGPVNIADVGYRCLAAIGCPVFGSPHAAVHSLTLSDLAIAGV